MMNYLATYYGVVKFIETPSRVFMDAYLNRKQLSDLADVIKRSGTEALLLFSIENPTGPKGHRRADLCIADGEFPTFDDPNSHFSAINTRRISVPFKHMIIMTQKGWSGKIIRFESQILGGDDA